MDILIMAFQGFFALCTVLFSVTAITMLFGLIGHAFSSVFSMINKVAAVGNEAGAAEESRVLVRG